MKVTNKTSSLSLPPDVPNFGQLEKFFLLAFSFLVMAVLFFGQKYFKLGFVYTIDRHTLCLFVSVLALSSYVLMKERAAFVSRPVLMAIALSALFMSNRVGPFVVECIYGICLISRVDKKGLYLRCINFVISISLMAILLLDPLSIVAKELFEKAILLLYVLRCAYINFEYVNKDINRSYEDILFSNIAAFLFLSNMHVTYNLLLLYFIPVAIISYIFTNSRKTFLALMVGQFLMFATSGLTKSILLLGLTAQIRFSDKTDRTIENVSNVEAMLFVAVIMMFLFKIYSQQVLDLNLVGVLSWQWFFAGLFFPHIYKKEYLGLMMMIVAIYLFY